jgi:hypothetical protein
MRKCTYIAKLPSKTPQFFKVKCRQTPQRLFAKRLKKITPNYSKYVKLFGSFKKK